MDVSIKIVEHDRELLVRILFDRRSPERQKVRKSLLVMSLTQVSGDSWRWQYPSLAKERRVPCRPTISF
jgi:hypothetical protein